MNTIFGVLPAEIKSALYLETKEALAAHDQIPVDEHAVELHMGNMILLTSMLADTRDPQFNTVLRDEIARQFEKFGVHSDEAAELATKHTTDFRLGHYGGLDHILPEDHVEGLRHVPIPYNKRIEIDEAHFVRGIIAASRRKVN